MPLPGGAADKFGNRYEGRWTVNAMADVLAELADATRLEPPGSEGEGAEFWLRRDDTLEYHQVKRQHSSLGHWTLTALASEGVLTHAWEKLSDPTAAFVFVSSHAADQLHELADRARRAASWEEFSQEFLKADQASTNFAALRRYWGDCAPEIAYDYLKRIWVRTIDEETLRANVEARLDTLVDGDSPTVADMLAQFALNQVHQELIANDIWTHLESRGYRRRQWRTDSLVWAAVADATDRYLGVLRDASIGGKEIPRQEVEPLLQALVFPEGKIGVLVTGEAGGGKSSVVLQAVEALREKGWPVLAFRVDRLKPALRPKDVGAQLGLPGSPPSVLGAIAIGRDSALVIDQLDAVSLASGRHPGFFDCIGETIKEARLHLGMRIVLVCRKFDIDNDYRLRHLQDDVSTVTVNRLPEETVRTAVADLGLDAGRLTAKQLDLLSVPLHLSLLAQVAQSATSDVLNFETTRDLYDSFWIYKQQVIERERLDRPVRWTDVLDALCDYMSEQQVLSAPKEIVDEWQTDAQAMESEQVLVMEGGRYSFFHEGFFDYAFARRFAARGLRLMSFLTGGDQRLFRRAQVRQILLYEREADRDRYLEDLRELLTSPDVRAHIKQVVFAVLSALADPTEAEWDILAGLMEGPEDLPSLQVWRTLHGSPTWFALLDRLGVFQQWLKDANEQQVDRAVMLLLSVQKQKADRVAELVEPHVGLSEAWQRRLVYLMQWGDVAQGRRFFDLFLRLIDDGVLDEARGPIAVNSEFWDLLYSLPKERPDWACEAIAHYLRRRLSISLAAGSSNPFDSSSGVIKPSQLDQHVFMESARGAPAGFVDQVLPFMLEIMELTSQRTAEPPWRDPVWSARFYGGGHGTDDALLAAMETALRRLAADAPGEFATIAANLRNKDFETVQYLLIRAYAANAGRFADEAAEYLIERPARLMTGYVSDLYWATRELLEAITPHCSSEHLRRLETVILDYYSSWERSVQGHKQRGHAQFVLLDGIDPSRRSEQASRRLEEWRRKFRTPPEAPQPLEVQVVGSPVPEHAADKMTDEQWLGAIASYPADWSQPQGTHLEGGAVELSRLLETKVKVDPKRFAELVLRFPDDANPVYFEAVLRGIADAGLDVETVLSVCRRCHQLPNRPCGRSICQPITKLASEQLPEEALDIVSWYATEDPDPDRETWRTKSAGGDVYYGGDILTAAINSVRGTAAEAVAQLMFEDGARLSYFRPTLERMVQDPSIAVRTCVALALTAVLRHDRDFAVNLFLRLCETEDVLLNTPYAERFLRYAMQTHFQALKPILDRMIASVESEVATAGAREACIASLLIEEAKPLAQQCLSGTEAQRIGAAQVFAANLRTAHLRSFCEEALTQLFKDSDERVRSEAAQCFNGFEREELAEYPGLIEAFAQSPAFPANHQWVIRALEETTSRLPDATLLVCERFLDTVGAAAGDIRTHSAADAATVSQLLVRVESQATDKLLRARCLDLIDRMTLIGAYGLNEALAEYERS